MRATGERGHREESIEHKNTRSVLFPTTTRHYPSVSSSQRGAHTPDYDHWQSRAHSVSVSGRPTSKMRMTTSTPRKKVEERAEWYDPWPSEEDDVGMWKVCAEVTVPLSARLNCKVHELRLDEHLGRRARRSRACMEEL